MATQFDVKPTIFESVSGESLGTFTLNVWKSFELGSTYKHLVAEPVIKQGSTTLPGSAYELAIDTTASAQETTASGSSVTLYGMMRITNATYAGVELNFSGKNYGAYASNEANRDFLAEGVAGKTEPGSDAFIEAGEPVVFETSTGTTIISENSGQIAQWDSGAVYNVAGELRRREGMTFAATGEPLNQNKDPLDPNNGLFWYMADDETDLLRDANRGTIRPGGMHTVHDRISSNYQQNMRIGKRKLNGSQQEFYFIHLDGSQVTGNATLESLFDVGGSNEYIYLDLYAPDTLGTRTLIDMGEYITTPQSSSGENDTIGELQDDRFQGWQLGGVSSFGTFYGAIEESENKKASEATRTNDALTILRTDRQGNTNMLEAYSDGVNGTPRTGLTTRPKEFTEGISYIVVMVAA